MIYTYKSLIKFSDFKEICSNIETPNSFIKSESDLIKIVKIVFRLPDGSILREDNAHEFLSFNRKIFKEERSLVKLSSSAWETSRKKFRYIKLSYEEIGLFLLNLKTINENLKLYKSYSESESDCSYFLQNLLKTLGFENKVKIAFLDDLVEAYEDLGTGEELYIWKF